MPDQKVITVVKVHKVQTGETLESIAKANGLPWQVLAKFNWGTSVPEEIDRHLRDDVGCTKKTKDRKNYIFDSSDDPGLIYIPKPFSVKSLGTRKTHVIRVRPVVPEQSKVFIFSI